MLKKDITTLKTGGEVSKKLPRWFNHYNKVVRSGRCVSVSGQIRPE